MKIKNKDFYYYLTVTALAVLFVLVFKYASSQEYIPITNHHNGISIKINGEPGVDFVFDRYYFDPLINDCGLCFIKSDVDLELSHNENNSRVDESSTKIIGGDFGEIRYRVDQDWRTDLYWAGDDGPFANSRPLFPEYTAPLSFDDMEYEAGVPVVGTTSFIPGVSISSKGSNYCRGLVDKVGNEYHYFTYADDDDKEPNWKNLEMSSSDGKSMLFCVNPKTPAIWLSAVAEGAEYYTTPGKVYWIPKFHEQISYVMDNVDIHLKNIMNSNAVYYRVDGGDFIEYTEAIHSNALSTGEHFLEFYYDPDYVQTRKIIKNPEHPSKQDIFEDGLGHGYLLWRDENDFLRVKDRILNGVWKSDYESYKAQYLTELDYSGNEGIRNNNSYEVLMYAIVGVLEGVAEKLDYMEAAKIRLLNTRRMHIENVGFEVLWSADPNPCHELTYRGYYDDWEIWNNAFAYDLLAKYYRSDQFPGGITPVEDLRIRDMMAQSIHEGLMNLGGFSNYAPSFIDISPESGMWTTALQEASVAAALAMPSYNTHYYGTSGFDGTQATHPWTPYPDYPESWKDVYLSVYDRDNPSHVERLHSFPNRRTFFDWYNGTLDDGLIRADGSWHDKSGYGGPLQMGHGMEIFYNIMKRKFDKDYPNLDIYMKKSAQGDVYCHKDGATAGYPRRNMANEYFPELAPIVKDYDPEGKYFYTIKPYHFFFHNPDWESVALCESTEPPTVPNDLTGNPDETTIKLTWSPSSHTNCIVAGYKIKRDGKIIAEFNRAQGTQFVDTGLTRGVQYEYSIASVSEGGIISEYCPPIYLTTLLDLNPPEVDTIPDTDISTLVRIAFNEEIDILTASNLSHFIIDNDVSVLSAKLQNDKKSVHLEVSELIENTTYSITIKNIKDIFGNTIEANTIKTFKYFKGSDNLAFGRPVIVDSHINNSFPGEFAVDGDNSSNESRWVSDGSDYPHWIEVDLLHEVNVNQLKFWVGYSGYDHAISDYKIQSWDGSNWNDILAVTGNGSATVDNTFATVKTSKIRLYCTAGEDNYVRMYEIELYGDDSQAGTFAVEGVNLSKDNCEIEIGDTILLTKSIEPYNATNQTVTWLSSNSSIASVNEKGEVIGVSEGTCNISVETEEGDFTATCAVKVTPISMGENLAFGKPVLVDSEYSEEYGAANAVDGNNYDDPSRWVSAKSDYPHWIVVDLEQNCDISRVNFWTGVKNTYNSAVSDYQIQYWNGSNWIDIINETGNESGIVGHSFSKVNTDKIRLYCTSGTSQLVRLYEIEVVGYPAQGSEPESVTYISVSPENLNLIVGQTTNLTYTFEPENATNQTINWGSSNVSVATVDDEGHVIALSEGNCNVFVSTDDGKYTANCSVVVSKQKDLINVALGKPAIADSEYSADLGAQKAVDGNNSEDPSRWLSASTSYPHWLEIDLQQICNISKVNFWTGYRNGYRYPVHDYQIQVWDGTAWVDVINVSGKNTPIVSHSFPEVSTDKVRLYCTAGEDDIVRLYEFEVLGTRDDIPPTGINISQNDIHVDKGQTSVIKALFIPQNTTLRDVTWATSNPGVATVDDNGLVTSVSEGECTITVTATHGGFTATCNLQVSGELTEYYCDPLNGNMQNIGSESSPWGSLQDVFLAKKSFKAGDVIYLLPGFHGGPNVSGTNSGNVTIKPISGVHPELQSLKFTDAAYWTVRGLKISPDLAPEFQKANTIVYINNNSNIILEECDICTIDDNTIWSAEDWVKNAGTGVYINGSNNVVRNCIIRNMDHGIFVDQNAEHNNIEKNLIANFSGDGLRGIGNYNTFQYNTIQDNYNVDGNHDDGFQSYSVGEDGKPGNGTVYGNVLRGNKFINITNPDRDFIGTLQGIGNFDGMFEDWVIENNLIVCNHYHGITLLGAINCKIINNTVVDVKTSSPGPAWIQIAKHKNGTQSKGNIIRNNITTDMNSSAQIGTVENNIEVKYEDFDSYFVDYKNIDFRLLPTSPAINMGVKTDAPKIDIDGIIRPQGNAYDIGAFEYLGGDISVTSVTVSPSEATLYINEVLELQAIVLPTGSANKDVSWSSDNNSVVTVDEKGSITAIAAGNATITATSVDGSYTSDCHVTVEPEQIFIVWHEQFTGLLDNVDIDNGTTSWSTDGGIIKKETLQLGGEDAIHEWYSESIDISSVSTVDISIDVAGIPAIDGSGMENTDSVKTYYQIDGGEWVEFSFNIDEFPWKKEVTTGLKGNSITIKVKAQVSYSDEFFFIDNIKVVGHEPIISNIGYVKTNFNFKVFPNPVSKSFFIIQFFDGSFSGRVGVEIFNITGSLLYKKDFLPISSGPGKIEIPIENLKSGVYIVRCTNNGLVDQQKLFVK